METCSTCKHWVPYRIAHPKLAAVRTKEQNDGGVCDCPKLTEDIGQVFAADMLVYAYSEGGDFWTGAKFGCVHHELASANDKT